ncbi:hypothetical protein HDV06_002969 [Boothiomyces sp. JEL0866]|nr:hypothetical protein HDV06_002969 [Boothiomyces sp. JEL0866]
MDGLLYAALYGTLCHFLQAFKNYLLNNSSENYDPSYLKSIIVLDLIIIAMGGLALNCFVGYFVNASFGTNLYDCWQFQGTKLQPSTIMKVIRLMIMVYAVVMYSLWATLGLQSVQGYMFYRRAISYFYATAALCITPVFYWILLSKIISFMTANYKKKNQTIPKALFYIRMIKYFILFGFGIPTTINFLLRVLGNEYLQDYLVYCLFVCDALQFFSTSGPALYLLFKSFPQLFKHKETVKRGHDKTMVSFELGLDVAAIVAGIITIVDVAIVNFEDKISLRMSQEFLYELCDYNVAQIGCPNLSTFHNINLICTVLHVIPLVAYCIYPGKLLINVLQGREQFSRIAQDKLAAASGISIICCLLLMSKYTVITFLSPELDLPSIVYYVKVAISLDMIFNSLCGLALSNMVGHIVGTVTGTNLYDLYEINGKPYNPSKLLKILRLFIMICTTTAYALWASRGLESMENFIFYRFITFTYFSCILFFVIPFVYWNLLSKIITVLQNKYRKRKEKLPVGLHYLKLLRYACVFCFAYPSLVNCLLILVGHTFYSHSPKLISFQIVSMGFMSFFSTVMSFYPIFKSFQTFLSKSRNASKASETAVEPTVRMEPCTQ